MSKTFRQQMFSRRTRLRMWASRLGPRMFCFCTAHKWDDPIPVMQCAPLDVTPEERTYVLLGIYRICLRCHASEDVPVQPGDEHDFVAEARQEDLADWDDPLVRAEWLEMVEDAEKIAREHFENPDERSTT